MLRLVLAEDNDLVRSAVKALVEAEPDLSVIGEASGGLSAIQLVEKLRPDMLVLDLGMPELNGLEVIERVMQLLPETKVVVLSMHTDEIHVSQALRRGARAYVFKACVDDLVLAIGEVVAGRCYVSQLGPPS